MLHERQCLRAEQGRDRRHRDVQLGLRRDHRPDPQPRSGRSGRHGQPGEHLHRPDHHRSGTAPGEPRKYYPTGKRNYARVVAQDQYQGAADAMLAKRLGVKSVYILNDKEAYGLGVASNMQERRSRSSGSRSTGFAAFDPKASDYTALATQDQGHGCERASSSAA